MKIGVLGHYGTQNLGDEAIIAAVLQNVRERQPNAVIYGFSVNPEDTFQRHKITSFPIRFLGTTNPHGDSIPKPSLQGEKSRVPQLSGQGFKRWQKKLKAGLKALPAVYPILRGCRRLQKVLEVFAHELLFLWKSYKSLKGLDLLIVAGSGQLEDEWGGAWSFPYTIFKWTVLAKLVGAKVVFMSVGAGPISKRLSKIFIRSSLALSEYSSFRDKASKQWIESIGVKGEALVVPDLAHSLHVDYLITDNSSFSSKGKRPVIGINPMPIYDRRYWHVSDEGKYENYVHKMASFTSTLLRDGYPLFFFSTQPKDEGVIDDIISKQDDDCQLLVEEIVEIKACRSVSELISALDSADFIVATRFHGILLSLHVGTPVVGICKDSKQYDILRDMGQSKYILPFESFSPESVLACLRLHEENYEEETKKNLPNKSKEYAHALKAQYDKVLDLVST